MELSNPQIARLVLGYLKSENCESAFHEFLINSQHLKSRAVFKKNGKYFATRVGGLTLEDILADYSEASLFIQGRLEHTDFYEKELTKDKKPTLTTQLFYILDHYSRSCSPTLPNNLNATPSESLPGNSLNNSMRTSVLSEEHTHPGFENISNVLTTSRKDDRKAAMADELDKRMKTIAEKKEQDPAFDQILEEFIGHKHVSSTDDSTSRNYLDKNQPCTTSNMDLANMTKMSNMVNPDNFSNPIKPVHSRCTKSSEMVLADPCPNKTATAPSQQNQYFLTNTAAGLLMVPSVIGRQSYILVNSAPTASSTPMQNVLTENDIMKMPTVILDDRGSARQPLVSVSQSQTTSLHLQIPKDPPVMTQSQIILSSSSCHTTMAQSRTMPPQGVRRVKTLAPKTDKITISTNDGEYYNVLGENKQQESDQVVSEVEPPKKSPKNRPVLRRRLSRQSKSKYKTSSPDEDLASSAEKSLSKSDTTVKKESRKSAKSLFKDNKNKPKKDIWDSDLRELLIPHPPPKSSSECNDSKMDSSDDRLDTTDNRLDVTWDDEELKKGALMIEAAFKTPVKTPGVVKDKDTTTPKEDTAVLSEPKESKENPETENESVKSDEMEVIVETEETEVYLRNCNGPPRFKKKCNQTGSEVEIFEVQVVDESTPEELKTESVEAKTQPGTSKVRKNIMLETPIKGALPKTPGKFEMTPLTKVLEEQLQGMDLLSLATPNIITPNFPMTPNVELNTPDHHANRPTDYSTSSSYYQPSDTEQNKSLETMMEQYRREDGKNEEEDVEMEEEAMDEKQRAVMSQMKRMFNENVIGKKNLSMMKREKSPSLEDSSNDSESSSSSDSESSTESDSDSDFEETVSKPQITSTKEHYSFRKRKSPVPKTPIAVKNKKSTSSPTPNKKIMSVQQEIKEKKERTIKAIKKENKKAPIALPKRDQKGKFLRRKNAPKETKKETVKKCDVENEITDDDFALHLSTDEDSTNKINNDTVISKKEEENQSKSTNNTKEPATEEAKQLIHDLSERGIYLVQKVSDESDPNSGSKKTSSDDENALENLELSSEDSIEDDSQPEASESFTNPVDVTFDIKKYYEEDAVKLVYDSSKRRKKKVFDLELLERKIQADVYIESMDIEIVRFIKCMPTENVMEYIPKKPPPKRRKSVKPVQSKEEKEAKIKLEKETKIKLEKDTKPKLEKETNTKLEKDSKMKLEKETNKNLEKETGTKLEKETNKRLEKETNKKLEKETNKKSEKESNTKLEKETNSKLETETKVVEIKTESKEKGEGEEKKDNKTCKSPQKKSETTKTKTPNKSPAKRLKIGDSTPKAIEDCKDNKKSVETPSFEADMEKTVIERLENTEEQLPGLGSADEDLMNFAVLGNLMEETSCKGRDKRKLSSEGDGLPPGKKSKTENEKNQALIKKLDVDSFLNKVHGDEKSS